MSVKRNGSKNSQIDFDAMRIPNCTLRNFQGEKMGLANSLAKVLGIDFGRIHFKHGKHCLFVPTNCHPLSVWVEKKDHGHSACCQSPKNWLSWHPTCGGIEFCAVVESSSMEIEWVVTKSCHCCGCLEGGIKVECKGCDTSVLNSCCSKSECSKGKCC